MAIIKPTDNLISNTTDTASVSDAEKISLPLFSQGYLNDNQKHTKIKNLYGMNNPKGSGNPKPMAFSFKYSNRTGNQIPIIFWQNDDNNDNLRFKDSSFKLVSGKTNNYNSLLKYIPTLQISEIQPSARMNRWINYLMQGWSAAENIVKAGGNLLTNVGIYFQAIFSKLYETSLSGNIEEVLGGKIDYGSFSVSADQVYDSLVLQLPYIIYSKLIMGRWLNSYEFPFIFNSNYLQSSGSNGWEDTTMVGSLPGMIGEVVGGLGLDMTSIPTWKMTKNGTPYPEFEYTVHLFNNTVENAVNNFILVNSIAMNNMWYQDGFLKAPSCLYDVYVRDMIRLFLCTVDITVENVGKMRIPPHLFNTYMMAYVNSSFKENFQIPDAYKLTLKIKSLMPNNVNTYLYGLYLKNPMHKATDSKSDLDEDIWQSIFKNLDTIGNKAINDVIEDNKNKEKNNVVENEPLVVTEAHSSIYGTK